MTEPIADRTHQSALMMWQSSTIRGRKPERGDFDHLNTAPATIPTTQPATPPAAPEATPAPVSGVTAEAVKAALSQMRGGRA